MSRSLLGRAAAFAAIAAFVAACGDQSATSAPQPARAPEISLDHSGSNTHPGGPHPLIHWATPLQHAVTATAVIGSQGGYIAIPGTGLTVVFPDHAVQRKTTFVLTANAGAFVSYTFEPHMVFSTPVAIIQDLSTTAVNTDRTLLSTLGGGYVQDWASDLASDGTAKLAETFTTYVFSDVSHPSSAGYAAFLTTHFSGYTFASACSGPTALDY